MRKPKVQRLRRLLLVGSAIGIALAGCSDGGGEGASPLTPPVTPAPAPTPTPTPSPTPTPTPAPTINFPDAGSDDEAADRLGAGFGIIYGANATDDPVDPQASDIEPVDPAADPIDVANN